MWQNWLKFGAHCKSALSSLFDKDESTKRACKNKRTKTLLDEFEWMNKWMIDDVASTHSNSENRVVFVVVRFFLILRSSSNSNSSTRTRKPYRMKKSTKWQNIKVYTNIQVVISKNEDEGRRSSSLILSSRYIYLYFLTLLLLVK